MCEGDVRRGKFCFLCWSSVELGGVGFWIDTYHWYEWFC